MRRPGWLPPWYKVQYYWNYFFVGWALSWTIIDGIMFLHPSGDWKDAAHATFQAAMTPTFIYFKDRAQKIWWQREFRKENGL